MTVKICDKYDKRIEMPYIEINFDRIDSLGFAIRRDFQGHLCENCYQKFLKEFLNKGE